MLKGLNTILNNDVGVSKESFDMEDISISMDDNNEPQTEVKDESISVEMTLDGSLEALEDIIEEDIEVEAVVGVEELLPLENNNNINSCNQQQQPQHNTIYMINNNKINAYLYGKCDESIDTLIHLLSQADTDTEIFISICYPYISIYDSLELVGVIGNCKGKITLNVVGINSVVDLLLLTNKNCNVIIGGSLIIKPLNEVQYGSLYNLKELLKYVEIYQDLIYSNLLESNILTQEEIDKLSNNGGVLFISKSDIQKRIGI
jgi:hypothetical protein